MASLHNAKHDEHTNSTQVVLVKRPGLLQAEI